MIRQETKETEKIQHEGWLPIFPGFYNTIFEPCEGLELSEIEHWSNEAGKDLTWDDLEWDYKTYYNDMAENCTYAIEYKLKEIIPGIELRHQEVKSPKYYNYSNDSINVLYILPPNVCDIILKYIHEDVDDFEGWIIDNYSDRPGFWSYHSNNYMDWIRIIEDSIILDDDYKLSAIFEYILIAEEYDQMSLYEDATYYGQPMVCASLPE